MAVSGRYNFVMNATETLTAGTPAAADATVVHSGYDETAILDADSTPPFTKVSYFLVTLVAGVYTIDLTALTGANGAVDGTGLKVQAIRVKNLGDNAMTFAAGASNGINIGVGTITVPADGIAMFYCPEAGQDIAAGDRTIDVAGTLVETAEVSIWMG
jgi:hypothetical protein